MADTMISAGGGLSKTKLALATAAESDVLSGKRFYAGSKAIKEGKMPNRGSISTVLDPNGSKYYPAGYYSGGTVTCNSVESVIKYVTFHAVYDATRNGDIYTYSIGNKIIGVSWMQQSSATSGNNNSIKYLTISGNTMTYRVDGGGFPLRQFTVAYI